jgi:4-diphosphocytidyl-2-C-methyl-D-erythritol kinase
MRSVTLPAYAKVNLHLDVLGRRSDGSHELVTLFERIDLADEVRVELIPGNRVEVCCDHPDVPQDGSNLVVRASQAYLRAAQWFSQGVRVFLKKRIPVGGGLGGGSSDAAATLQGLQQISGGRCRREDLLSIAKTLGADVPFFLTRLPWALGRGRGDELEPWDVGPVTLWHLLVSPGFPIPTRSVYEAFDRLTTGEPPLTGLGPDVTLLHYALRENDVSRIGDLLFNALEPTVEALYPIVRRVKTVMQRQTGIMRPMVSGSGSTVMALCTSQAEAMASAEILHREESGWRVWVSSTQAQL